MEGFYLQPNLINKNFLRWLLPIVIVVLSIFLLQYVLFQKNLFVQELKPQDGMLDIRDIDFSTGVFNIANQTGNSIQPAAISSEDFAPGAVKEKTDRKALLLTFLMALTAS